MRLLSYYILNNKTPMMVEDVLTWGEWFEKADRRVAWTQIGEIVISTVFLGLDHNYSHIGPPILFETMVLGGEKDEYVQRYAIWEEAEWGHREIVNEIKNKHYDKRRTEEVHIVENDSRGSFRYLLTAKFEPLRKTKG